MGLKVFETERMDPLVAPENPRTPYKLKLLTRYCVVFCSSQVQLFTCPPYPILILVMLSESFNYLIQGPPIFGNGLVADAALQ